MEDRRKRVQFKMEQMGKFMEIIENLQKVEENIKNGSLEDKYLALLMKQDVEHDLDIILGIENDRKEENKEILGKAILESLARSTEE
tara:strand:+ start:1067 stop:1327 length:261 start_codon:yes stop_codon:yes gene_type:complete